MLWFMGSTRALTDKPIERETIYEDGRLVAHHGSDVVTDPNAPEAVQIADPEDYPTANATKQNPLAEHQQVSPADALDPDNANVDEVQTLTPTANATGGTFTITILGDTTAPISSEAAASQVSAAILAALGVRAQDGEGHDNVAVTGPTGGPWAVTFQNDFGAEDQPLITVDDALVTSPTPTVTVNTTQQGGGGNDEVQVITEADATGGTFTLTYSGQTTAAIPYNETAVNVQAALIALSNLAPGDVVVTGSAGGPWTVTFGGTLANTNVSQITADATLLTNVPDIAVAEQTKGVRADA